MIRTRSYVSQSVQQLRPSGIRRYFDIAATMEDVVSLGIGEPDFVTPRHIIDKSIESLRMGQTAYTNNSGTIELRRAIAGYIERLYGVNYDPEDQIVVTVGVSEAMWLALRADRDPWVAARPVADRPSHLWRQPWPDWSTPASWRDTAVPCVADRRKCTARSNRECPCRTRRRSSPPGEAARTCCS